jgi:hypothetical protein
MKQHHFLWQRYVVNQEDYHDIENTNEFVEFR